MSELRKLENERISISVDDFGAQLSSAFDKKNQRELLWCANPDVWNRHAPVLFPFVGELYEKKIIHNGKKYPMTAHGFARDSQFIFEGIKDETIIHHLTSDDEKREVYPFEFDFYVKHSLLDNCIKNEWIIENKGNETMYFQVGGHPAFNVPMPDRKDYYLNFGNDKEKLDYIRISKDGGTALTDDIKQLMTEEGLYKIGENLFDDGVLIFENGQLAEVGLNFPDKTPYVRIKCEGFPYVGVWTKPQAPFVCLEPWYGRCDDYGFNGELKDKTGIISLNAGETFNALYYIEIF